jgi:HEXXH motif-containing protein
VTALTDESTVSAAPPAGGASLLSSTAGLVGPAQFGQPVDVLHSLAVLNRESALSGLLKAARAPSAPLARLRDTVLDAIEGLGVEHRIAAFGTPAAGWDARGEPWPLESLKPTARADPSSIVWRHLVGIPLGLELTVVIASPGTKTADVDLPHHGVRVVLAGPVAVTICPDGGTVLVWDDGVSVTLAPGRADESLLAGRMPEGRVSPLPWTMGLPVEPADPRVMVAFADFKPASPGVVSSVLNAHREGLWLLGAVWPEELDTAARWVTGWFPLQPVKGVRSHTSPSLPGVLLSSAHDPWSAIDAIVHECAHMRIGAVLHHDLLLENAMALGYTSPWRVDPRPLLGLLLGVHAFVDICSWHRRVQNHGGVDSDILARSEQVYERQAKNCRAALATLSAVGQPTASGAVVLAALAAEVQTL